MEGFLIALGIKSLALLILFGLIALPARLAVQRYMKDGKLKRFLMR